MQHTCIFCKQALDGSDEHIIPDSINGKLHSKRIICSACNNRFGTRLDPIVKETFGFLLHVLKIGNARKLQVYDKNGKAYHVDNQTGSINSVKLAVEVAKRDDGKIQLSVEGNDEKKVLYAMAKKATKLFGMNALKGEFSVKRERGIAGALSAHAGIDVTPKLHLLLYKILLEFSCFSGLDRKWIEHLLVRVGELDEQLPPLQICNTKHQVRVPAEKEISHLIVIRSDAQTGIIYGYLELFNTLCAYTVLAEGYDGKQIDYVYHQDAVNKKMIDGQIILDLEKTNEVGEEFEHNLKKLFEKELDRRVEEETRKIINSIKEELTAEVAAGKIKKENYDHILLERATEAAAHYMVFVNPYAFSDHSGQQLKEINYLHSVIYADKKKDFEYFYHQFIGKEFLFEDTKHLCLMESFIYSEHMQVRDRPTFKVYCRFVSKKDDSVEYGLASNLFRMIGLPFLPEKFIWL